MNAIHLIYLDDDHLEDPLFLQSMAQLMHHRHRLPPMIMVHGSGGQAERLLEAEGLFPKVQNGIIAVTTPAERALVERGYREATRNVVGAMVDEVIYAVGFQGADRGLLRRGANGTVQVNRLGWILELTRKGAIPVVSSWVRNPDIDQDEAVRLEAAFTALALALKEEGVVGVFFTKKGSPGVFANGEPVEKASAEALEADLVADPEAVRALVRYEIPVFLTSPVGLFGGTGVLGTEILP